MEKPILPDLTTVFCKSKCRETKRLLSTHYFSLLEILESESCALFKQEPNIGLYEYYAN